MAPNTYDAAKTRAPSARSASDVAITQVLAKVPADNYRVYQVCAASLIDVFSRE